MHMDLQEKKSKEVNNEYILNNDANNLQKVQENLNNKKSSTSGINFLEFDC